MMWPTDNVETDVEEMVQKDKKFVPQRPADAIGPEIKGTLQKDKACEIR